MSKKRTTWLGLLAVIAVAAAVSVLVAPGSVAEEDDPAPKADHYKCYNILDWGEWEPQQVKLQDQFGMSEAAVLRPYTLCNPVDKNGEGIADKDNHLVCYQINDDPTGNFDRIKEVVVQNQFGQTQLWVGIPSRELCLPSSKKIIQ